MEISGCNSEILNFHPGSFNFSSLKNNIKHKRENLGIYFKHEIHQLENKIHI